MSMIGESPDEWRVTSEPWTQTTVSGERIWYVEVRHTETSRVNVMHIDPRIIAGIEKDLIRRQKEGMA